MIAVNCRAIFMDTWAPRIFMDLFFGEGYELDRQDGGWDYPPGGGVHVDRKEEGGILLLEEVEGCVRAGFETVFKRLIFMNYDT